MKKKIAIVASEFNKEYVDGLVSHCQRELRGWPTLTVRVPGAYEIPLMARRLLGRKEIAVVIAFGVIWQGKTAHADLIASAVTNNLMALSLEFDKPVIHQVLDVSNEKQARERCFGKALNRGVEGARAALTMMKLS
ncbi:MAG: 6,7-dimethyl-8-ribityllumazine synthase [Verrucomicrobiales bacterium]|jgi:6,7-dimethyl-8-ribityllumazine synthase|nr:6,7-dimethyl-8-ribityllumazine synthase [Verrucomicrobiales bacterium]